MVGISWYEALAYSRWLHEQFQIAGRGIQLLNQSYTSMPVDYGIRLPSEAEWEKAARGMDNRRWSWGNEWQDGVSNTKELGLNQTTPVGIFPGSMNGYGVHDITGNIWEWTQTRWGRKSIYRPDYRYPYVVGDEREDHNGVDLRILRGGSYHNEQRIVRCANRPRSFPDLFDVINGVRLVVSLASCC